ncbi:Nudix hydrolase domain-containing protein [Balamuthia mandrillaris]
MQAERSPVATWNFALVVVRNSEGKFLLVKESRNRGWWVPGGRVEMGESFTEAAIRETKEEGGIPVVLKGLLRVEHTPSGRSSRMRVIFYAEPADDTPPKSVPDEESLEARWVTLEELQQLSKQPPYLRGTEPTEWFGYVANGGPIFPISLLCPETQAAPPPEEIKQQYADLNQRE